MAQDFLQTLYDKGDYSGFLRQRMLTLPALIPDEEKKLT